MNKPKIIFLPHANIQYSQLKPEKRQWVMKNCYEKLFDLADEFLNPKKQIRKPWLFYLWGHSYEFDVDNNWDRIEKFCETVGNRDDIWYATNIEIYDYAEAYRSLQTAADGTMIYNPTRTDVWFYDDTVGGSYNGDVYCVKSGETITIKE